jgi:peptide/nickel transport system substrate-binding protein
MLTGRRLASAALIAVLGLAAACGGSPSSSSAGTQTSSSATTAAAQTAGNPGKTLVIADSYGDPTGNWDPMQTSLIATLEVLPNVIQPLVTFDSNGQLQPVLATSWSYADPKTVVVKLRQGVKFSDGEDFNADAVKFTFDRIIGSEGAKFPVHSTFSSVASVQVVDPYTVEFHLNRVDPLLVRKLTSYQSGIVPPQYMQSKGEKYFQTHPVGTGPYLMTDYKEGSSVTLQANPNYWGGAPRIQKVVFQFLPDPTSRVSAVEAGSVDLAQMIPPSQVDAIKALPNYTVGVAKTFTVYFVRIDVAHPPLNTAIARQAVNYAINKQEIINKILNGYGGMVNAVTAPTTFGYDPQIAPYPYDPAKAKQLLQQAGIKPGTELQFDYDGANGQFAEVAQAIADYLDAVGFNVKLQPEDFQTLYTDLVPKSKAGNMYEFFWGGGGTLDFDGTAVASYQKGQYWNPSYDDPKVDALIQDEENTVDQSKRLQDFYQIDQIVHDAALDVPLYQTDDLWAVSKQLQGFVPPADEQVRLAQLSWAGR